MRRTISLVSFRDRIAGAQRLGARERQEDNFLVLDLRQAGEPGEDKALLLLADGMGGHVGGATASKLALQAFSETFQAMPSGASARDRLSRSLEAASEALAKATQRSPELQGMGCTLVGALVGADKVEWVSVGDSPLWLIRNGALHRLNEDHSMRPVLEAMADAGEMTREEALRDKRRNALRSALDSSAPRLIDLNVDGYLLQAGDMLLLASDGVESLNDGEIVDLLESNRDKPTARRLDMLLDAVIDLHRPGQDNATAILLDPILSPAGVSASAAPTVKLSTQAPAVTARPEEARKPGEPRMAAEPSPKKAGRGWWLLILVAGAALAGSLALWLSMTGPRLQPAPVQTNPAPAAALPVTESREAIGAATPAPSAEAGLAAPDKGTKTSTDGGGGKAGKKPAAKPSSPSHTR